MKRAVKKSPLNDIEIAPLTETRDRGDREIGGASGVAALLRFRGKIDDTVRSWMTARSPPTDRQRVTERRV